MEVVHVNVDPTAPYIICNCCIKVAQYSTSNAFVSLVDFNIKNEQLSNIFVSSKTDVNMTLNKVHRISGKTVGK